MTCTTIVATRRFRWRNPPARLLPEQVTGTARVFHCPGSGYAYELSPDLGMRETHGGYFETARGAMLALMWDEDRGGWEPVGRWQQVTR